MSRDAVARLGTGPGGLPKAGSLEKGPKPGLSAVEGEMPETMVTDLSIQEEQPSHEHERQLIAHRARAAARCRLAWDAETAFVHQWADRARSPVLWETDRRVEAEELGAQLYQRPGVVLARLEGDLHGVRWLLERWLWLDQVLDTEGTWDDDQRRMAKLMAGVPVEFLNQDPLGLASWTAEALKEWTNSHLTRLDRLESGDLREIDESRRQLAIEGLGHFQARGYQRLAREFEQANRMYERATAEIRRSSRSRGPLPDPVRHEGTPPAEGSPSLPFRPLPADPRAIESPGRSAQPPDTAGAASLDSGRTPRQRRSRRRGRKRN